MSCLVISQETEMCSLTAGIDRRLPRLSSHFSLCTISHLLDAWMSYVLCPEFSVAVPCLILLIVDSRGLSKLVWWLSHQRGPPSLVWCAQSKDGCEVSVKCSQPRIYPWCLGEELDPQWAALASRRISGLLVERRLWVMALTLSWALVCHIGLCSFLNTVH